MSDLYETDVLRWSEQQGRPAAPVQRRGERVNAQIDWENVAEEIESVGRSERRACESQLLQALLHDLKAAAWPLVVAQCAALAGGGPPCAFRQQAVAARVSRTVDAAKRIDLADIYRRALNALPETVNGRPPLPVPQTCPVTLEELLGG